MLEVSFRQSAMFFSLGTLATGSVVSNLTDSRVDHSTCFATPTSGFIYDSWYLLPFTKAEHEEKDDSAAQTLYNPRYPQDVAFKGS